LLKGLVFTLKTISLIVARLCYGNVKRALKDQHIGRLISWLDKASSAKSSSQAVFLRTIRRAKKAPAERKPVKVEMARRYGAPYYLDGFKRAGTLSQA
jgi:hypothetical protein